jgi:hypothetical protein
VYFGIPPLNGGYWRMGGAEIEKQFKNVGGEPIDIIVRKNPLIKMTLPEW